MGFADDVKRFRDKALKNASDNTNKIASELFKTTVDYSPTPSGKGGYSLGTIKDNWYSSVSTPDTSFSGSVSVTGDSSLSRIDYTLSQNPFLGKDNVVFLTNSTKWAYRADKIGWPSGDTTNDTGWDWTGKIGPYMFTSMSVQSILNRWSK